MKPILVLYATREGQTHKIAEYLGDAFRDNGFNVQVMDALEAPQVLSLENYSGAVVAASVHVGKHEPEMIEFVRSHRAGLERMPSAFLSVSASQAGVEMRNTSAADREKSAENVASMIEAFEAETGWTPPQVMPVAGALMYRKYNLIVRFIMRRIARREGGSTDTSRNVEYTDWKALDRFAQSFGSEVLRFARPHAIAGSASCSTTDKEHSLSGTVRSRAPHRC
jgi:menaquinone-dependent protoporphyrinogen oxidase